MKKSTPKQAGLSLVFSPEAAHEQFLEQAHCPAEPILSTSFGEAQTSIPDVKHFSLDAQHHYFWHSVRSGRKGICLVTNSRLNLLHISSEYLATGASFLTSNHP